MPRPCDSKLHQGAPSCTTVHHPVHHLAQQCHSQLAHQDESTQGKCGPFGQAPTETTLYNTATLPIYSSIEAAVEIQSMWHSYNVSFQAAEANINPGRGPKWYLKPACQFRNRDAYRCSSPHNLATASIAEEDPARAYTIRGGPRVRFLFAN